MKFVDGSATDVGNWLRNEEFDDFIIQKYVKWNATAMLAISEAYIIKNSLSMEERRLLALLSASRHLQCRSRSLNLLVIVIRKYLSWLLSYANIAFH